MPDRLEPSNTGEFDVFISHATEDKDFAGPLAHGLRTDSARQVYVFGLMSSNLASGTVLTGKSTTVSLEAVTEWWLFHQRSSRNTGPSLK